MQRGSGSADGRAMKKSFSVLRGDTFPNIEIGGRGGPHITMIVLIRWATFISPTPERDILENTKQKHTNDPMHFENMFWFSWIVGSRLMAPPTCRGCGDGLARLKTVALQTTWQYDLNYKWHWISDKQAYWFYCMPCHSEMWHRDYRAAHNR